MRARKNEGEKKDPRSDSTRTQPNRVTKSLVTMVMSAAAAVVTPHTVDLHPPSRRHFPVQLLGFTVHGAVLPRRSQGNLQGTAAEHGQVLVQRRIVRLEFQAEFD